jgi:prostaglandin-H2 D-isomerase / glutathione transferase
MSTTSSESFELVYHNGRCRAEVVRLLFAEAGIEYKDTRLDGESFVALKPSLPNGQLPVLKVGGKVLAQSFAIQQFVAQKLGFYTDDAFTNAKVNELTETAREELDALVPVLFSSDVDAGIQKFATDRHPIYLTRYERVFSEHKEHAYAFGEKPTLGDFAVFFILDEAKTFGISAAVPDEYPHLQLFMKTMYARPKVAEWLKNRPETPW